MGGRKVKNRLLVPLLLIATLWVFESAAVEGTGEAPSPGEKGQEKTAFDPQEELKRVNHLLRGDKDNADLFYNRGWIHEVTGDLESAKRDYTKAIEINPAHADAYYNRGRLYLKTERAALAIKDLSKTIELRPESADAYCNRGNAYLLRGENDLALMDYNAALKLDSEDPDLYYNRAVIYLKRGDRQKAVADLKKAASAGHEPAKRYLDCLLYTSPSPRD